MRRQITNFTADVTVIGGASRDGIALVLALADSGLTVNVNDSDLRAIEQLEKAQIPFLEHGAAPLLRGALEKKHLVFSNSPDRISPQGPVIITIGTSVDKFFNPQRKQLQDCIDGLLPYLGGVRLIVLRSSVFPGTTEWVDAYLNRHGQLHKVAFCPERSVQGYGIREFDHVPQIIGGTTADAEKEAIALFQGVVREFVALSPREAEFARLFNNAYKYINCAATNEFYAIATSAGLDYQRILGGMKHDNPRARNIPSPGLVGGPNLLTDTVQLAAYCGHKFGFAGAAMLANEGLVLQVIDNLRRHFFDLSQTTIGLLGMAFKAESDDIRGSLSYKFKKLLGLYAREVLTTDPLVTVDTDLLPLNEVVARSDVLILCTPHELYRNAELQGKPVVDVWGFVENGNFIR